MPAGEPTWQGLRVNWRTWADWNSLRRAEWCHADLAGNWGGIDGRLHIISLTKLPGTQAWERVDQAIADWPATLGLVLPSPTFHNSPCCHSVTCSSCSSLLRLILGLDEPPRDRGSGIRASCVFDPGQEGIRIVDHGATCAAGEVKGTQFPEVEPISHAPCSLAHSRGARQPGLGRKHCDMQGQDWKRHLDLIVAVISHDGVRCTRPSSPLVMNTRNR